MRLFSLAIAEWVRDSLLLIWIQCQHLFSSSLKPKTFPLLLKVKTVVVHYYNSHSEGYVM